MVETDAGLVNFLEKFVEVTKKSGFNVSPTTVYRLDPNWLEPYLDPSLVIKRITTLEEEISLTENQAMAIKQFIEEYDVRQQGKEPDE